jgi:hypothetical protein
VATKQTDILQDSASILVDCHFIVIKAFHYLCITGKSYHHPYEAVRSWVIFVVFRYDPYGAGYLLGLWLLQSCDPIRGSNTGAFVDVILKGLFCAFTDGNFGRLGAPGLAKVCKKFAGIFGFGFLVSSVLMILMRVVYGFIASGNFVCFYFRTVWFTNENEPKSIKK